MTAFVDDTRGARSPYLRLLLADGCNLTCTYCHFHAEQDSAAPWPAGQRPPRRLMAPEVAEAAVQAFADSGRVHDWRHFDLTLYGGEPLINPRALEAALAATEAVRAAGMAVTPIVNTNATLVTAAIAQRLAAAGARAHVSLDGPDLDSNVKRRLHSGAASFSAAMRGLSELQRAGVPMQLNVVVTAANLPSLVPLMGLARDAGCDQVFLAMPDDAGGHGVADPAQALPQLLAARAAAHRQGLRTVGPWSVGLRAESEPGEWPWSLVVRADGRVFVPHFPDCHFETVAQALAPAARASHERAWQAVLEGCRGCALERSCRGYLKMMVRYHAGAQADADPECNLARRAAIMLEQPAHRILRTALHTRADATADGDYNLGHPRLAGDPIQVSAGVLDVLDFFLPGATAQAAADAFEAESLDDTLDVLLAHGLLVQPDDDIDRQRFAQLVTPQGEIAAFAGLLVGVADPSLLERAAQLRLHLERAVVQLPARLRPVVDRHCVFVAADAQAYAAATGIAAHSPWLAWMAGTVADTVVVLQLEACEAVLAQGGRARILAFEQQLAHELVHVALRQRGLRLPVWLEEGLCEQLSSSRLDSERLRVAAVHANAFAAFVRACMSAESANWTPDSSLLHFSDLAVDENAGYALAQDFVALLERSLGRDALLDGLAARGLRGWSAPFPLDDAGAGLAGVDLDGLLVHWRNDLALRVKAPTEFGLPMRLSALGRHAIVYNRIIGGHAWLDDVDVDAVQPLLERNLSVDDVAALLQDHPERDELLPRWYAGQLARRRGYHLRLTLEGGCNMSCSYCYEGEKPHQAMSRETADQAVAAWRDLLEPGDLPGSSIRMFGGEPFMNWPVMKHVFETATTGLPAGAVQWFVNTNGTLIRDEHVEFLAGVGPDVLVHLSLDGVAAVNDRNRVFLNQVGTFAYVDRAARKLLAAGVPLNIAVTLTPHNAGGLGELMAYVGELRTQHPAAALNVSIKPVIGPGLQDDEARQMLVALELALDRGQHLGLDVGGEPLRAANLLFQDSTPTGHFCGVTGRELYVTPAGRLMVCHAMPGSEYSNLAEVAASHHIPVPADVATRHAGQVDGCSGCEVEGLCGGGCMAQSKSATGSIASKPSDYFCLLMKTTFRRAVRHSLQARAAG